MPMKPDHIADTARRLQAIADNLGGTATFLNLPAGAGTTTIESKTNFFAAVPLGDTLRAECTPLHRGRTTMVWQTRIIRGDRQARRHSDADAARHAQGCLHVRVGRVRVIRG